MAFCAPLVLQTIARVLFSATQIYYKILKVYGGDIIPWEIVSLVVTAHAADAAISQLRLEIFITSAKEVMFSPVPVCVFVCVCLPTRLLKNY